MKKIIFVLLGVFLFTGIAQADVCMKIMRKDHWMSAWKQSDIIKLTPEVWDEYSDSKIAERIRQIPYVINAYRVLEANASHILLMGFRDLAQMDKYIAQIQTKFAREIEIKHIYPFATEKKIIESPVGLLYEILDKKEFPLTQFFLKK